MQIEQRVGPQTNQDGAVVMPRLTRTGDAAVSDVHGRFQEAALRQGLYAGGMTITSVSNATFSTATLGATATPIIGVWNPSTSGKNLVILQAKLQITNTALQTTGAGGLMWCTSTGNAAVSTGNIPLNLGTLAASGSVAKDMTGVALTGLTNNLVVRFAAGLGGLLSNLSTLQTAVGLMPQAPTFVDNIDGSIIVPPGGVLALLCTTNPPVAISASAALMWEEVNI